MGGTPFEIGVRRWPRSMVLAAGVAVAIVGSLGCASIVTTEGGATLDAADDDRGTDDDPDGQPPETATVDDEQNERRDSADTEPTDGSGPAPGARVAASFPMFVGDWDGFNATLHADDPDIDRIELAVADFIVEDGLDGEEIFASQVNETAIIGGIADSTTGAVASVVVGLDPDGETAGPVVITTFGVTGAPGEPVADLVATYTEVATGPIGGDAYIVSGSNDFVIQKVEGANADDPLMLITVAPVSDEDQARAAAAITVVAVLNTLLEG